MKSQCTKCGSQIVFIKMVNAGKWSSHEIGANKCQHTPGKVERS